MKQIITQIFAAILLLLGLSAAQAEPGYLTTEIEVLHREKPLPLHIWYPSNKDGSTLTLGKNIVFTGVDVREGGTPKPGKYPVVLLSHGSGGNAINLGWIGAYLAQSGMIVVSTNHSGTTSRDSKPLETLKIWQRAADFSSILDYLQKTPPNNLKPDMEKIGAIGFSLGGNTVLGMVGAQVKKQKYIDYCDQYPESLDCRWYNAANIDLSRIDAAKFEQNNLEDRIKTVVAIDPALAQAYDKESLKEITLPSLIINLGSLNNIPIGIDGKEISEAVNNSRYANIKDATHFSFLGLCTAIGEQIIKDEGDDPICSETGERQRQDIHEELKKLIGTFLSDNL